MGFLKGKISDRIQLRPSGHFLRPSGHFLSPSPFYLTPFKLSMQTPHVPSFVFAGQVLDGLNEKEGKSVNFQLRPGLAVSSSKE